MSHVLCRCRHNTWDATGFQKDLINGLTDSPLEGPTGKPRMNVIKKNAQSGLAEALKSGPKPPPPTQLMATFLRKNGTPMVRIENTGPAVTQLSISALQNQPKGYWEIIKGFITPNSGAGAWFMPTYKLPDLDKGGEVCVEPVFIAQPKPWPTLVGLDYHTDTGHRSARVEVRVTPLES